MSLLLPRCGPVVNKVCKNPEVSGSNHRRDKNTRWFLPAGERWQVSMELVEVSTSWLRHHDYQKDSSFLFYNSLISTFYWHRHFGLRPQNSKVFLYLSKLRAELKTDKQNETSGENNSLHFTQLKTAQLYTLLLTTLKLIKIILIVVKIP